MAFRGLTVFISDIRNCECTPVACLQCFGRAGHVVFTPRQSDRCVGVTRDRPAAGVCWRDGRTGKSVEEEQARVDKEMANIRKKFTSGKKLDGYNQQKSV